MLILNSLFLGVVLLLLATLPHNPQTNPFPSLGIKAAANLWRVYHVSSFCTSVSWVFGFFYFCFMYLALSL